MGKGVRLKGIKRVRSKGRVYVYRVVRGKRIRLPDLAENHPDFLAAYVAAEDMAPADKSLASLIERFLASSDFRRRKDSTRTVWRRRLDGIREAYGKSPVDGLRTEHVTKALRKLTPGAARSERTIWRAVMAYAVQEGWRYDNPAKDAVIARQDVKPHAPWTPSDILAFRAKWPEGTPERQAFEVIFWTGARCIDAARIGWQWVEDGVLVFVQEKTDGSAYVPITAPVEDFLRDDRRRFLAVAAPNMVFITTRTGRPRSVKALSQLISAAAKSANLPGKTAHGLRKSRAIILAENGWTPHQIGAWTGHDSLQEVSHYTRDANKRAMVAVKPFGKLANSQNQPVDLKR